jgi:RimJ/RimL family protein N-acetyltransferase
VNKPPEVLQTARLRLRPPTVGDAEAIFHTYAKDPEVTPFLVWSPHRDIAETVTFLQGCESAWREGGRFPWVIEQVAARQLIGMIELRVASQHQVGAQPGERAAGSADVGYVIARPCWRKGYATEALRAVVDAAFTLPGLHRLWAVVDVENVASQRVLEKGGLRRETLLRRHLAHPNISTEPRDVYRHAITR